jgi:class 3 adenylate cyclase
MSVEQPQAPKGPPGPASAAGPTAAQGGGAPAITDVIRTMSMTDIIRLQNMLSQELTRRFEKQVALGFSDIVGSTPYFARFGDEAGRKLQQRHFDFLAQALPPQGGRVVDTAGDGAFLVFPTVEAATTAFIEMHKAISADNATRPREHQLQLRIGLHWGPVLTDGQQVTGDAVNLTARVTASGSPGDIRLTKEAFQEFSNILYRLSCRPLGQVELKGIFRPVELLSLEWRDRNLFPDSVRVEETGEEIRLPHQDTITFGRLKENDGVAANDIVLALGDEAQTRKISRWHFELRRHAEGFQLRAVSDQITEVDGQVVQKGAQVPIKPGSVVRVARVATLKFFNLPMPLAQGAGDSTICPTF